MTFTLQSAKWNVVESHNIVVGVSAIGGYIETFTQVFEVRDPCIGPIA